MFAYIQGKLIEKNPAYAIIDANGVGYFLHISLNTYVLLGDTGLCKLYTHQVIREDAQLLYGFATEEERDLFRLLISVSGVGPNTARLLLSSLKVSELKGAINSGQAGILKSIKGIGEKSAQRIIVDLKDKLGKQSGTGEIFPITDNTKHEEALSALVMLGFGKNAVIKVLDKILAEDKSLTVEDLIKRALRNL